MNDITQQGTGDQNSLDKHTEQTNPISTILLWQKQAALKSTLSCVGTAISCRMAGVGRNDIWGPRSASNQIAKSGRLTIMYCNNASDLTTRT